MKTPDEMDKLLRTQHTVTKFQNRKLRQTYNKNEERISTKKIPRHDGSTEEF